MRKTTRIEAVAIRRAVHRALILALLGDNQKAFRRALLDYGSETEENVAASKAVRRSRSGWRVGGYTIGDIVYEIEDAVSPELLKKVRKRLPRLTKKNLENALRIVSLVMLATEEPR